MGVIATLQGMREYPRIKEENVSVQPISSFVASCVQCGITLEGEPGITPAQFLSRHLKKEH